MTRSVGMRGAWCVVVRCEVRGAWCVVWFVARGGMCVWYMVHDGAYVWCMACDGACVVRGA
jgi:hypothetical protein